jgi:hypothetical protein
VEHQQQLLNRQQAVEHQQQHQAEHQQLIRPQAEHNTLKLKQILINLTRRVNNVFYSCCRNKLVVRQQQLLNRQQVAEHQQLIRVLVQWVLWQDN